MAEIRQDLVSLVSSAAGARHLEASQLPLRVSEEAEIVLRRRSRLSLALEARGLGGAGGLKKVSIYTNTGVAAMARGLPPSTAPEPTIMLRE